MVENKKKAPSVYGDKSAIKELQSGAKLSQSLIERMYPTGDATNYGIANYSSAARQTLMGLLERQSQNLPERVGAGGDALEQLYQMIPIRLRAKGSSQNATVFDENEALREQTKNSIFNLEQVAKAEKLKARKRDKQAFGGGPSTPEKRIPVGNTQGDVGTLLGSSNTSNKTLLGG